VVRPARYAVRDGASLRESGGGLDEEAGLEVGMLLAVILVVLGMLANAVALVAVATCLWWSRRWRIIWQDT
jgi:hypothetical protein